MYVGDRRRGVAYVSMQEYYKAFFGGLVFVIFREVVKSVVVLVIIKVVVLL